MCEKFKEIVNIFLKSKETMSKNFKEIKTIFLNKSKMTKNIY